MKIVQSKRGRRSAKRMDMTAVRAALRDKRYWCGTGTVVKPAGESSHFEPDGDVGILVHVELHPNGEPVFARLMGFGTGLGRGVWAIPALGAEVAVLVPEGEIDNEVILLGPIGEPPSGLNATNMYVVCPAGGKVFITDGTGVTEPLVKASLYDVHTHPTGVGPSGPPTNAGTVGTAVLESK